MHKIWLGLAGLLFSLYLVGCGTEAKNFCPGGDCRGPKWAERNQAQCGGRAVGNFHEITLRLPAAVPTSVAVEVNGSRRVDECNTPAQTPPYVSIARAADNRLVVHVDHQQAYPKPPARVSLRVFDLKACEAGATPTVLAALNNIALDFQDEAVNGPKCPPVKVARVTVQTGAN